MNLSIIKEKEMPDSLTAKLVAVRDYIESLFGTYEEVGRPEDKIEDLTEEEREILSEQIQMKIHRPRQPVPSI